MEIRTNGRWVVLAAALVFPVAVHAADSSYTATLAKPLDEPREVITNSIIWHCQGNSCVTAGTAHGDSVWTCHQLADQVGDVTAYGSASHQFDTDRVAKCNGH